jgi:hypothetical protein
MTKAIRIGLVHTIAPVLRADMVFIHGSRLDRGNKTLPDTRLTAGLQRMAVLAPAIKIPHHVYLHRIGSPDSKICPAGCIDSQGMRPELFIQTGVRTLVEVMQITITYKRDSGGD